jgi:YggT family protein
MVTIIKIINGVLTVYLILLFIRILLSWFSGPVLGAPVRYLYKATDPYLRIFRKFKFLQTSRIDFSPIAAVITLVILLNITSVLATYRSITFGIILAIIVSSLWSAVFFILAFFMILSFIRLLGLYFGASSVSPIWQTLDVILDPLLGFFQKKILRNRQINQRNALLLCLISLVGTGFLGRFLINRLVILLQGISF